MRRRQRLLFHIFELSNSFHPTSKAPRRAEDWTDLQENQRDARQWCTTAAILCESAQPPSDFLLQQSEQLGLAWAIRETEIHFYRPLFSDDIFQFTIWLMRWRRVRGTRGFELRLNGDGALIAQGVQQVVTLDGQTMRPASPPEDLMENFLIGNPRLIPQGQLPEYQATDNAFKMEREVEWRDLDTFEHVNNATYASYAENLIIKALESAGWSPSELKLQGLTTGS